MNQRENTPEQWAQGERVPQSEPLPLVIVTER